jgi:hypothetical protein
MVSTSSFSIHISSIGNTPTKIKPAGKAFRRASRRVRHAVIETLEVRQLLSTSVNLTADAGANAICLERVGNNVEFFQNQPTTATPTLSVPFGDLGPVTITGGGPTTLTLDFTNGDLLPAGLTFTGATTAIASNQLIVAGVPSPSYTLNTNCLSITGTAAGATFADSVTFTNLPTLNLFNSGGVSPIEIASGSFTFNTDLGAAGTAVDMTVDSGASVYFGCTQHVHSLEINAGGFVQMTIAGGRALVSNSLVVDGVLDLTDNDLIVNDPSADSMSTLQEQVAAGYHNGWSAAYQGAIISSTATTDGLTIGVAPAVDTEQWSDDQAYFLDGQSVPSTGLVARYTEVGDAGLTGGVDGYDFTAVVSAFSNPAPGLTPPKWYDCDFYYAGSISGSDYVAVVNNFYNQVDAAPTNVQAGEPYSVSLADTTPSGDSISRWDINWGDGNFSSYPAGASTASHVYTGAGTAEIQETAIAPDGTAYNFPAVPLDISAAGVTAVPVNLAASASTDVFAISSDGEGDTIVTQNGTIVADEPTQNILALNISGGAAGVSINFTNGDPLPVGGFYSDASIVELDGPHGSDPLVTTATAAMIGNDVIRYSANTTLTDNLTSDGGILAIAGTTNLNNPAGDSLIVAPGATVYVNGSQTFSSLTIDAGATVRQVSQDTTFGASVITVGSLNIENPDTSGNGGGVLDLGNGDLIVRAGISPDVAGFGATGNTSLIEQWLAAGYDGGAWDGEVESGPTPAAIVSSATANDPYQIESFGFAQIGTATDEGELNLTTFDGQTVSSGDAVVALTYYGDANLDRQVNSTDYSMIGAQYPYTGVDIGGWTGGDFNYDGFVDGIDNFVINNALSVVTTLAAGSKPTITIKSGTKYTLNNGTETTTAKIMLSDGSAPGACTVTSITSGPGTNFAAGAITVGAPQNNNDGSYSVTLTIDSKALASGSYIVTMQVGTSGTKGFILTIP